MAQRHGGAKRERERKEREREKERGGEDRGRVCVCVSGLVDGWVRVRAENWDEVRAITV